MLDIILYCVNFDAFFLKELDKNEEFKSNLIVANNNVVFSKKTS